MLVGPEEGRLRVEVALPQVRFRMFVDEDLAALRLGAGSRTSETHSAVVTLAFLPLSQ